MASIILYDDMINVGDIEVERSMGHTHLSVGDGQISMTNEEWHEFREEIL